jgi:hypothetical protein
MKRYRFIAALSFWIGSVNMGACWGWYFAILHLTGKSSHVPDLFVLIALIVLVVAVVNCLIHEKARDE